MLAATVTDEQRRYLSEGLAHRSRFYRGRCSALSETDGLTIAIAWWCGWWRAKAERADCERVRAMTPDLFSPNFRDRGSGDPESAPDSRS